MATRHDVRLRLHGCAWPASWPRSGRRTCAFPGAKRASCFMPRVIAAVRGGGGAAVPADRGVGRGPAAGGDLPCRSPRPGAVSSPSSPAATARSASTCSPRCSTRQPPGARDLLLRTSLLDRVNGELAGLLTGRPGSERILLELEDANGFVESLDAGRAWFRYHHLLADFLRLELRRTLPRISPGAAPAGRRGAHRTRPVAWRPSGTPRRRATGPMRPGCSPTIRSA